MRTARKPLNSMTHEELLALNERPVITERFDYIVKRVKKLNKKIKDEGLKALRIMNTTEAANDFRENVHQMYVENGFKNLTDEQTKAALDLHNITVVYGLK